MSSALTGQVALITGAVLLLLCLLITGGVWMLASLTFREMELPFTADAQIDSVIKFEAELGIVIGKTCRGISSDEADDYIFGYTCVNDVTAPDTLSESNILSILLLVSIFSSATRTLATEYAYLVSGNTTTHFQKSIQRHPLPAFRALDG